MSTSSSSDEFEFDSQVLKLCKKTWEQLGSEAYYSELPFASEHSESVIPLWKILNASQNLRNKTFSLDDRVRCDFEQLKCDLQYLLFGMNSSSFFYNCVSTRLTSLLHILKNILWRPFCHHRLPKHSILEINCTWKRLLLRLWQICANLFLGVLLSIMRWRHLSREERIYNLDRRIKYVNLCSCLIYSNQLSTNIQGDPVKMTTFINLITLQKIQHEEPKHGHEFY